MRSSSNSNSNSAPCYGLFIISALVLAAAAALWGVRTRSAPRLVASAGNMPSLEFQKQTQDAVAMLVRAFVSDNKLTYSAISTTTARMGTREMHTEARVTRAPNKMAIVYLKGDRQGLHSGFNDRWFWRQSSPDAPMRAYATVQHNAGEMAARRFALLLQNYWVRSLKQGQVAGRQAEWVEIRPFHPVDGATGPGKLLAIDRETGLTLQVETFNYQMQPVMSSTLSQIDLSPRITPDTFESPEKILSAAKTRPWMAQEMGDDAADVAKAMGIEPPQPQYLPPGFDFDGVGIHYCNNGDSPNAALSRYTDGLNTLTVFAIKASEVTKTPAGDRTPGAAQPSEGEKPPVEKSPGGQTCDFGPGTLVMRDTDSGRVIAVADLPSATLQRVADSTNVVLSP